MGDEIRFEPGLELCVRAPGEGRIVVVANGKRIATTKGRELRVPCTEPGAYRAEVWVRVGGRELAWILASPIYVRGEI